LIGTTGQTTTVTCNTGYSGSGTATCGTNGQFNTLTCTANSCTATEVVNSNKAVAESITGTTGQTVVVTCDLGFTGSGSTTCSTSGTFISLPTCIGNTCTPTGNVANSNKATTESITGTTTKSVTITCNAGYIGTGTTTCQADGTFSTVPTCIACALGKYNDDTANLICKDDCSAGSYIVEDKSSCDVCLYGQWQDLEDQSSCKKCAAGKILKKQNQISDICEDCVVGLYNPYPGHPESCLPCETAADKGASVCAGW